MISLLKKLFAPKMPKLTEATARVLAEKGTTAQRKAMAADEHSSQEVLLYLAEHDPLPAVRQVVAANPSTPLEASPALARDASKDVRLVIARRLTEILPSLSEENYSQLYAYAVQALGTLALDEVLKIRRALSETLKDYAMTPPALAAQLGRDLEKQVAAPILRYCAAVTDDDLIDILKTHPANWAAEAIAARDSLSELVSEAVIGTGNTKAGAIVLANEGAAISPALLTVIVSRAREYPEWHKPLAGRKNLSQDMAKTLAGFADRSVRELLVQRGDYDAQTIEEISRIVQRRLVHAGKENEAGGSKIPNAGPLERATDLYKSGNLTEDAVSDALAMRDTRLVIACLAVASRASIDNVQKVFDARAPRSICAVCWRCGFSARLALKLQQTPGHVGAGNLIYPRGGTDYKMTEDELRRQLAMIGLG